jgi:hypothetical protein
LSEPKSRPCGSNMSVAYEAPVPQKSLGTYRLTALAAYRRKVGNQMVAVCVMCGYGIEAVLEVAHLDQNRKNNEVQNLAVLCPNCHKMHDIGLLPTEVVRQMRDLEATENWGLRMKGAAIKAAKTRRENTSRRRRSDAARKAWERRNQAAAAANNSSPNPSQWLVQGGQDQL